MDDATLKNRIGRNIAFYRKNMGLTQAGLAERLNYSDKAVSKWERGDSVPDVLTLMQLSELFGVTVNHLLCDPDASPEEPEEQEEPAEQVQAPRRRADRRMILLLSSLLCWSIALLIFVVMASLHVPYSWAAFVYAIPINAIVLLSILSAWRHFRWNRLLISAIMWGCLASIHVSLYMIFKIHYWRVYLLGLPGQMAIFAWFRMLRGEE